MLRSARFLYPLVLSITKNDPERGHQLLIRALKKVDAMHRNGFAVAMEELERTFTYSDPRLQQTCWGLSFPNVLGLSAGCDKEGEVAAVWPALGFGFAELGAVTRHPQPGNDRPRLFRLPQDRAVLNRLGANNEGAVAMAAKLKRTWGYYPRTIPIGINLCKSKITPLDHAVEDYVFSFRTLAPVADYFVVNVSSPNTPGLRSLQESDQLPRIFEGLQSANHWEKPILVKISPDLSWGAIAVIIDLVKEYNLGGIVATNTSTGRSGLKTKILPQTGQTLEKEAGGLSGEPIRARSTEIIRYIYQQTGGEVPIIGVGGIFNAEDAWEKIQAGASLLQLYTGWIYGGPWVVADILQGLGKKLTAGGFSHISQVVGAKELRELMPSCEP
ncbi:MULTISPECIES: quinone-dependent dihydroorotate dehydrogenase [unclassified Synechocystis]|uniref:quinone-dependent dihydroorotate dehydrogenase n=1 Tax=unclassified Synechocystis TaxID=2640012 RepID=UPI000406809B|nr:MULTISPECIES: quinone-dependent dihydroorotate dehydrogenase [unclassified Synechocystis]AIE74523.1 Dihydroorotate dehydrogenase [Synechocystis sp. PCC 6714]MCT0254720.1 quinone-dependent dihydroorotate dehydrogenase [Synechocystis sp. CS-94]